MLHGQLQGTARKLVELNHAIQQTRRRSKNDTLKALLEQLLHLSAWLFSGCFQTGVDPSCAVALVELRKAMRAC
jgi:hypothetical protein